MMNLSDKFFASLQKYKMLSRGDDVLVAFSGGADSVCLLALLYTYKDTLGISLRAAHVNHCLRGDESDADEAFVRSFCRERNIPLFVKRIDIPSLSIEMKESTELCARKARYAFFDSLCPQVVATAHTGSDAIETLFMNLSRGSTMHGLASIPPVRNNIIRPLIFCTRQDTENYCKEYNLHYVNDSSNASDDYTRNRIRHHVIPEMQKLRNGFDENALRCIESLRLEDDYMRCETAKQLIRCMRGEALNIKIYASLHPAMRLRVLSAFLKRCSVESAESRHLQMLDAHMFDSGFALTVPGGIRVTTNGTELSVVQKKTTSAAPGGMFLNKNFLNDIVFQDFSIHFSYADISDCSFFQPDFIDFYKIDDIIEVRTRLPGDRITLAKRNCSKTLKKLFSENGYPPELRASLPVICDSKGIIWVYGAGADRSRIAGPDSGKILIIKSERVKNEYGIKNE